MVACDDLIVRVEFLTLLNLISSPLLTLFTGIYTFRKFTDTQNSDEQSTQQTVWFVQEVT